MFPLYRMILFECLTISAVVLFTNAYHAGIDIGHLQIALVFILAIILFYYYICLYLPISLLIVYFTRKKNLYYRRKAELFIFLPHSLLVMTLWNLSGGYNVFNLGLLNLCWYAIIMLKLVLVFLSRDSKNLTNETV